MGRDLLKSEGVVLQDGCGFKLTRGQPTIGRLLREVNSFSLVREEVMLQPLYRVMFSSTMFVWKLLPALMHVPKAGNLMMMDASNFAVHLM